MIKKIYDQGSKIMNETNVKTMTKKRITWVDVAKGLCMFLVIAVHTLGVGQGGKMTMVARGVIMSFHMPLYFILSAYTYKPSENMEQFKKSAIRAAKHLLIPTVIIFIVRIIFYDRIIIERQGDLGYWIRKSLSFLMSSGVSTKYAGLEVPAFGMIWFLVVLFVGRTIFDYLYLVFGEKYLLSICVLGSVAGVTLGKIATTFMCFDIALAILPLLYFGYRLKSVDFSGKKAVLIIRDALICMMIWGALLYVTFPEYKKISYLELASRNYPIYPLCFIIAILGTVMFCKICCLMDKVPGANTALRFIGKNSLYLYMIHCLDKIWDKLWTFDASLKLQALMRCLTDLGAFVVLMLVMWGMKNITKKR